MNGSVTIKTVASCEVVGIGCACFTAAAASPLPPPQPTPPQPRTVAIEASRLRTTSGSKPPSSDLIYWCRSPTNAVGPQTSFRLPGNGCRGATADCRKFLVSALLLSSETDERRPCAFLFKSFFSFFCLNPRQSQDSAPRHGVVSRSPPSPWSRSLGTSASCDTSSGSSCSGSALTTVGGRRSLACLDHRRFMRYCTRRSRRRQARMAGPCLPVAQTRVCTPCSRL